MKNFRKRVLVLVLVLIAFVSTAFISINTQKGNELAIERLDHVALRVVNFQETVNWYKDNLGFMESIRWKAPEYIDPSLEFAYLELAGFQLEIAGGGNTNPVRPEYDNIGDTFEYQGYLHVCIVVSDISKTVDVLKSKGIEIFAGPNTNPTLNRKFIHVKDLNGNDIEFVEYLT